MAISILSRYRLISTSLAFFCMFNICLAFKHKDFNLSTRAMDWSFVDATGYGSPNGAGSDGGACGYGNIVSQAPLSSMVTGIGPSLYKLGKECGACYEIKCMKHPSCSRKSARVVIMDFCPGGPCLSDAAHFDLSGTAFGTMVIPSQRDKFMSFRVLI
ncbi:hypothetical protein CDL12_17662 [Handroanthus impetiginosus]|uniref:Expansin-like EG45 domain-containing protein n=1 Tax=Handroanthus impetiginosus TaxID=429701 RepID=A0A2G9GWV3_9LAMI|nr:hypothetical protein CDL12_17662 [Handroanthus impetiginosus]